ncbi:OmpA family protein [Nonomuraea phyllanthi]|uniref:OmpA family protein n=1 Tax=Nonomuraea phyllanthi TaxID=2219224 RepID=UPI0018854735|nr:OmpA family protein [Nonomuraea phyllanthi]
MPNRNQALAAALILAVTGCGMLPGTAGTPPPPSTPAASGGAPSAPASEAPVQDTRKALAETRSTLTEDLKVEVVGLNRIKGKHLVVQLRLSNTGTEDLPWTGELGDHTRPLGEIRWASGIGVLDAAAHRWLLPYQPEGSPCLCSDQERDGLGYFIDPGRSITVYGVLPAPSGNPATVTIVTPLAPPLLNVPVSDEPPAGDFPDPDAQPVTAVTRRILLPSESLDKSEETADDGTDLRVNLSSDVLFAVDKATLTGRARAVLARTAKLVDASPATVVKVEGHADSSGDDAINDPLSRRRALAVQRALAGLLSRDGVRFESRGYGSRRPLYDNGTEEGRRRNRRVTVTFAKPAEPAPRPTGDPVQTQSPKTGGPRATAKGQPIGMEVTGLRRLPGGLGLLTYTITNEGPDKIWFNDLHHAQDWESYKYQAASDIRLTDGANRRRYLPGRLQVPTDRGVDAYCACTDVSGVRIATEQFAPGQSRTFWSLFALPDDATSLRARIAAFPELEVPVR